MVDIRFRRRAGGVSGFNESNQNETRTRTRLGNTALTQGARRLARSLLRRAAVPFNFLRRRGQNNNSRTQENRQDNNPRAQENRRDNNPGIQRGGQRNILERQPGFRWNNNTTPQDQGQPIEVDIPRRQHNLKMPSSTMLPSYENSSDNSQLSSSDSKSPSSEDELPPTQNNDPRTEESKQNDNTETQRSFRWGNTKGAIKRPRMEQQQKISTMPTLQEDEIYDPSGNTKGATQRPRIEQRQKIPTMPTLQEDRISDPSEDELPPPYSVTEANKRTAQKITNNLVFTLNVTGSANDIRKLVSEGKKALENQGADTGYLDRLESQLVQETRQIHIEAMLLKLLKKAATPSNSEASAPTVAEAINLVKNARFIKHQAASAEILNRIAEKLANHTDLKNINVGSELEKLQESKNNPFEENIDISELREMAIKSALSSNRIDKENTGLENSIIVDSEDNLVALKNSASVDKKDFESEELHERLADMAMENYDEEERTIIREDITHRHPTKVDRNKGFLGKGSFGKVRFGENVLTGESVAVKKMNNTDKALIEAGEKQKLMERLQNNPDDIKYFLAADAVANSKGKNEKAKAYLIMQLQNGDGVDALEEVRGLRKSENKDDYIEAHGKLMIDTMTTLEALDRNNIVHSDLKWENIIGGKIADLDGLRYGLDDPINIVTPEFMPPEIPIINSPHLSQESYDKHTSFIFGRMLLVGLDDDIDSTFPLRTHIQGGMTRPSEGYSAESPVPEVNSRGESFTPYEKDVIRLAFSLADTEPENRPSITEAKQRMNDIITDHSPRGI